MDNAQEMSNDTENLAGEVAESLGDNSQEMDDATSNDEAGHSENSNETLAVQKRLKAQRRAHDREMRAMQSRIDEMQSRLSQGHANNADHYADDSNAGSGVDEQIHKAVSYALRHKEMQERKAREDEQRAHVHRQYGELHKHLDTIADKYDDFDEVVRGQDAPFTDHMRDASLLLPRSGAGSAGEVLYKLGKNPEELKRISKLHPLDQASELVKLSHALINGGASKGASGSVNPLGNIKNNPVTNSRTVTEKTPVSDLRKRMKAGGKSWG